MKRMLLALALTVAAGACTMEREQPDQGAGPGNVSRTQQAEDVRELTPPSDDPGSGPSEYQAPGPDPVTPPRGPVGAPTDSAAGTPPR